MKLKSMIPVVALLIGLSACGSGSADAPAAPAGNQQAAAPAQSGAAGAAGKAEEEPLTGDTKAQAEKAAVAEFPGTVKKSQHDAERPGTYAVEIEQASGEAVEVYLDKSFAVVDTKNEPAGGDGDDG